MWILIKTNVKCTLIIFFYRNLFCCVTISILVFSLLSVGLVIHVICLNVEWFKIYTRFRALPEKKKATRYRRRAPFRIENCWSARAWNFSRNFRTKFLLVFSIDVCSSTITIVFTVGMNKLRRNDCIGIKMVRTMVAGDDWGTNRRLWRAMYRTNGRSCGCREHVFGRVRKW